MKERQKVLAKIKNIRNRIDEETQQRQEKIKEEYIERFGEKLGSSVFEYAYGDLSLKPSKDPFRKQFITHVTSYITSKDLVSAMLGVDALMEAIETRNKRRNTIQDLGLQNIYK